jgi:hypothetical protein
VGELSNAIERAVVLGSEDVILAEDPPEPLLESARPSGDRGSSQSVRTGRIVQALLVGVDAWHFTGHVAIRTGAAAVLTHDRSCRSIVSRNGKSSPWSSRPLSGRPRAASVNGLPGMQAVSPTLEAEVLLHLT